jgi:hypothetical protein
VDRLDSIYNLIKNMAPSKNEEPKENSLYRIFEDLTKNKKESLQTH